MANQSGFIKLGPVGSVKCVTEWDQKGINEIVQIFIWHGEIINSIQVQYVDSGKLLLSKREGSSNYGNKFDVVKLDYPAEYITWISCHESCKFGHVSSIKFGTNRGEYGPFGRICSNDKEFCFSFGGRQFGGFHGTAGMYGRLASIGFYLKPVTTLKNSHDDDEGGVVKIKPEQEN